jgi:small-conductance mechanosensitive channel
MESTTTWASELAQTLGDQLGSAMQYIPGIIGAVVVLVVGWILARVVRRAMTGLANTSNSLLSRAFPTGILAQVRLSPRIAAIVGELLFWSILLIAVAEAARISGLDAVSHWLDKIAVYVPNLMVAAAILIAGYILSLIAREQFESDVQGSAQQAATRPFGKLAQVIVLAISLVVALDQLGVDVTLLIALAIVAASAVGIAFGVSFSLGARDYMTNIIGIRTARSKLHAGQRIRIDQIEGRLLEITPTQIALETEEGKALIPGRLFDTQVTLILTSDQEGETHDD